MISFYPGPSRVYEEVPRYVKQAFDAGILSLNHRSKEFEAMSKETVGLLKKKIGIPADYTVLFLGSATECWEIISQSIVQQQSIHGYNGAFGEKWFDYTRRLRPQSIAVVFDREESPDAGKMRFDTGELICITQNETSNGTQVSDRFINQVKQNNPRHLIAVDATSSMAGIRLNFKHADIWFASVQKCFGLPAGLAVMALSPRAVDTIYKVGDHSYYNSLPFMIDMMAKWQTSFTPNVLGIYLLNRSLAARPGIGEIQAMVKKRAAEWHVLFKKSPHFSSLVKNKAVQSHTVIAVEADADLIEKIKKEAKNKGFLLGEGYGSLKATTFRIANFPALKNGEILALKRFLKPYM